MDMYVCVGTDFWKGAGSSCLAVERAFVLKC